MKAAKAIKSLIDSGEDPDQAKILKELALSLETGRPFPLHDLYEIDMRYFDIALDLLKEWRFDHHISSRNTLFGKLLHQSSRDLAKPH